MRVTSSQLTFHNICEASERIKDYIVKTPLIRAFEMEKALKLEHPLFFKAELFQRTRSFKERGAYNAMLQLPEDARQAGVITRSSGNFAQAFSCAAATLGFRAHVVMPTSAPKVKIENTRRWGSDIILHGTTHVEGMQKVRSLIDEHGFFYVPPFDDDQVIAGQGTAAQEITDDGIRPRHFFCAVGGGGLMAGCALWLKSRAFTTHVVAAEPEQAPDFQQSMQRGERVTIDAPRSLADGLLPPVVGERNWPILRDNVDAVQLVAEKEIAEAMAMLARFQNLIVEPSGAVALAALCGYLRQGGVLHGAVVCMLSGGNVDLNVFQNALNNER